MTYSFTDLLALLTLLVWPVIPLFWVPVHCKPDLFRRLGVFTYLVPFFSWVPVALLIYKTRETILAYHVAMQLYINGMGVVLFALGAALQIWTLQLLTARVIMGMPEVMDTVKAGITRRGPFSRIRHPTYFSHTLMLAGVFFWTGSVGVGIATVIDALVVNAVIIPLEERELLKRFGAEYEKYCRDVPRRFLPW
ncbi:MAG TPA: isoprenylcysteine carboxylmethyltransferase family protein [Nitrospirota bacterium]